MDAYFLREDLAHFSAGLLGEDNKELWEQFLTYYGTATAPGALDGKTKKLIALAIALSHHCPYCIEAYTTACVEAGFEKAELAEVLHLVASMSAGMALVNGVQMKRLEDKISL